MQIVIAGKAHPKDQPGKSYIREIVQLSRDPELWKHVVFVEDYDMKVARELVQGVDLWLNNPRRGEEACGTSGMKAAINGVLNLSILDGWFDEAYEALRRLGHRRPRALLAKIRTRCTPAPFTTCWKTKSSPCSTSGAKQTPREWMRRVKQSLTYISPHFDCRRMVREYMTELVRAGSLQHLRMRQAGLRPGPRKSALERTHPRSVGPRALRRVPAPDRPVRWSAASRHRCAPPSTWPG